MLAAIELKTRTSDAAAKALAEAAVRDNFWGVRIEATKGLSAFKNDALRAALIEAVKDKDSRIRREAIKGLAAYNDPKLANLFIKIINTDPSYFAIAEAARALGQSGSPQAYEVLAKALTLESWQGTIRAGVLGGFAALKDPRAIEAGLKYATPANPSSLRSAAFQILAEAGKGNDRVLETFLSALKEKSNQARFAAVQALAKLGDQRAIPALEELGRGSDLPANGKQIIIGAINQIKNSKKEDKKD